MLQISTYITDESIIHTKDFLPCFEITDMAHTLTKIGPGTVILKRSSNAATRMIWNTIASSMLKVLLPF
ncbi:hypothetical protein [Listeria valentina]|uniref:hypothetical protein n=1 Tax=Listeria valentina TaxID=2705293 RepID=UPI00143225C8|nr:hypothetical protein [Listeria valentina]